MKSSAEAPDVEKNLQKIIEILEQMLELAGGGADSKDEVVTNSKLAQLSDEVICLAHSTRLNDKKLLDNSARTMTMRVSSASNTLDLSDFPNLKFEKVNNLSAELIALYSGNGVESHIDIAILAMDAAIAQIKL
jgi:flagellin-like hook-associated protein FlgL